MVRWGMSLVWILTSFKVDLYGVRLSGEAGVVLFVVCVVPTLCHLMVGMVGGYSRAAGILRIQSDCYLTDKYIHLSYNVASGFVV